MYPLDDTIVAVASPPGGAARGIVRLSGPRVRASLATCFRADGRRELSAAVRAEAIAGSLRLAGMASPLPCELYLWPEGRSYTRQPVAEIHTLGSRPLLEAVVRGLCASGARLAEPGEFTLRAFLAGRIDLTQAEAVLGVIDAADPGQLEVALSQLAGGLAGPLGRLRDGLVDLLAHLEAGFDFADEDLPFLTADELAGQLDEAAKSVARLGRQMASRGEAAPAVRAVLVGWPNVGKSSLFNALSRQAGALVSEHPGTTRDYLTAELELGGVKCQLIDTAGLGPKKGTGPICRNGPEGASHKLDLSPFSSHEIEQAARAASREQSRRAHVQIFCLESTRPPNDWERSQLEQAAGGVRVVVLTKIDLLRIQKPPPLAPLAGRGAGGEGFSDSLASRSADLGGGISDAGVVGAVSDGEIRRALPTSSVTGEGIDRLRDELRDAVLAAGACGAEVVAGTAVRCRESLRLAAEGLERARQIAGSGTGEELVAAELRVALDELGKVAGAVYTEDVLDRIFSRFCIGK